MSGRLTFLTLPVDDLDAARAFYREVFGWSEGRASGPAWFFPLTHLTVALLPRAEFTAFTGRQPEATTALVSWNVHRRDEVAATLRRARKLGGQIRREAGPLSWGGHAGILETPEAHLWEIVWNPRDDPAKTVA